MSTEIVIHTIVAGDVEVFAPNGRARAIPRDGDVRDYIVRAFWRPVPASRFDRLVGDVWSVGEWADISSDRVEDCLVSPCLYRDRTTGQIVPDSAAVRAEIMGAMVPSPRSSRA